MTAVRVLHVDDDCDIRDVVEASLGLDPDFATQSCASGSEALGVALDWAFENLVKSINDFWLTKFKLPQQQPTQSQ